MCCGSWVTRYLWGRAIHSSPQPPSRRARPGPQREIIIKIPLRTINSDKPQGWAKTALYIPDERSNSHCCWRSLAELRFYWLVASLKYIWCKATFSQVFFNYRCAAIFKINWRPFPFWSHLLNLQKCPWILESWTLALNQEISPLHIQLLFRFSPLSLMLGIMFYLFIQWLCGVITV